MKYWIVVMLLILNVSLVNAASDSDFENLEVKIAQRAHKDLIGYPIGFSDSCYFVKSASRIFLLDQTLVAKISNADIGSKKAEFTITDSKYGEGTLQIFSDRNLKKIDAAELKRIINASLSDENVSMVVVDPTTKTYHLATSNHLPSNGIYLAKSVADSSGYKECGVCFFDQLYLPDYDAETVIQNKGAAELRHLSEHLLDPTLQSRIDRIGKRVLAGWPYPLIGYFYKFNVVESREINAFALPAGSIFVTSALLNAVDNDDELEAVLAHEIAHVERRHGLKTYQKMVKSQQAQMALQMIGGVAAGVAVANNRPGIAAAIGGTTLGAMVAIQLQQMGYSKEQEKEADEFAVKYFTKSGKNLASLKAIFKKLMYHNLCSRLDPDPTNPTHPPLGSRLNSLIEKRTVFATAPYHFLYKKKPLEIRILSTSISKDGSELLFYVSDFDILNELMGKSNKVVMKSGPKEYEFITDPDSYTSTDPWGGMVTARSNIDLSVLPEFDNIAFSIYVNFNTGKTSTESDLNSYPDIRVYKLVNGNYY